MIRNFSYKYILLMIFIMLSLTAFVSCKDDSELSSGETQPEAIALPYEISVIKDEAEDLRGTSGSITLMYPQIEYRGNEEKAENINKIIRNMAVSVFKSTGLDSDDIESYSYITETSMITLKRENFFSAVITGYYMTDTAPHQEYFSYSINCDIENERLLTSADFIKDFTKIRSLFLDGKFSQNYGMESLLEETNYTDIFTQYRPEYEIYPDVYFTSSSFGMIVEVVYHLEGNACFEIKYGEVQEYLNTDLPALSGIFKD